MDVTTIKSPLRYPGGKTRGCGHIVPYIPESVKTLCAPFLGGASIELVCAGHGIKVHGYDSFAPLVNFWQILLKDSATLAKQAAKLHPLSRNQFYQLQSTYAQITDKLQAAAAFYALNRSSFNGTTLSGGFSPGHPRFNAQSIKTLGEFTLTGMRVKLKDFTQSIPKHPDDFLYCDPPYANGQKLYGNRGSEHHGFDHEQLASLLTRRKGWLLSYNDCKLIRTLYTKYRIIPMRWAYGMNRTKKSNEILILSRDIKTP